MSELPNGWIETALTNLATIEMGQSPDSRSYNSEGKGLPFFQGKAEFQAVFPEIRKWCSEPTKVVERGDILLSIRAPVGPTNIAPEKSCIGRGLAGIRAETGVNQSYLYYFFKNIEPWLSEQGTGSTFAAISGQFVREITCPVAPAAEQTRIVAKLEELLSDLDAGVAELKAAQKKLGRYRQSLLKAAVEGALTAEWRAKNSSLTPTPLPKREGLKLPSPSGRRAGDEGETGAQLLERILKERRARWEAKQLAKFAEQGKTPPKDWQKKYPEPVQPDISDLPELPEGWVWASLDALIDEGPQNGLYLPGSKYGSGTPILRIDDYQIGWHRARAALNLVEASPSEINTYATATGDIVINRVNSMTHLGKSLLISDALNGTLFESNMMRLTLSSAVSGEFVVHYLGSDIGRARLIRNAKQAVNQASINQQDVRLTPIPLMPEDEQNAILQLLVEQLGAATELEPTIAHAVKQSTAQRQNILRAAFAGQLVPQDPNDEPASVLLERIRAERAAQVGVKKSRGRKTKEPV